MSKLLSELIGPTGSMAYMKRGVKARQVTTHTHDAMPMEALNPFKKIGHWDFKTIRPNGTWEFPEMKGPGCVTALWITVAGRLHEAVFRYRVPAHRYLWINVYYDGSDKPAIRAPIGHFFGNGTSRYVHFSSKFVGMTSGGYYCFLPMPFLKSCRVVMENRHKSKSIPLFYGAITYHETPELEPDIGYLHTQYRADTYLNSPDVDSARIPNNPHVILEETGAGNYVGTTLTIYPTSFRSRFKLPYFLFPYLEGNLKVYVDDEVHEKDPDFIEKPVGAPHGTQSIECTGVEDYFLSGWYYIKGPYSALWHGCPIKSYITGVVSQYRFHEADPYPWNKRILMTMTHGEFDHVDCRMESLAYYYKPMG